MILIIRTSSSPEAREIYRQVHIPSLTKNVESSSLSKRAEQEVCHFRKKSLQILLPMLDVDWIELANHLIEACKLLDTFFIV